MFGQHKLRDVLASIVTPGKCLRYHQFRYVDNAIVRGPFRMSACTW